MQNHFEMESHAKKQWRLIFKTKSPEAWANTHSLKFEIVGALDTSKILPDATLSTSKMSLHNCRSRNKYCKWLITFQTLKMIIQVIK